MKKKIYIRADASASIGTGHVVRCIALADMLKHDFYIQFVAKSAPENIINQINMAGFSFMKIDHEHDFLVHLNASDLVVLDHYSLGSDYQKNIKSIGCKLVCIDDLHDKEFFADLIINHAPGVTLHDYKAHPNTKYALGLSFALLRSAFLENAKSKQKLHNTKETLFICFGGSDFKNLTEQVLRIAKSFFEFKKIIVVTGSAYSNLDTLQSNVFSDSRIVHYHAIDENQMIQLLKTADLAIVPASGMLFEVLTFTMPVITGSYVDNQAIFLSELTKYKQVINCNDFSDQAVTIAIQYVLQNKIAYDEVFDGNSAARINDLFKKL